VVGAPPIPVDDTKDGAQVTHFVNQTARANRYGISTDNSGINGLVGSAAIFISEHEVSAQAFMGTETTDTVPAAELACLVLALRMARDHRQLHGPINTTPTIRAPTRRCATRSRPPGSISSGRSLLCLNNAANDRGQRPFTGSPHTLASPETRESIFSLRKPPGGGSEALQGRRRLQFTTSQRNRSAPPWTAGSRNE
jgi:hypothetical protein